ncbi:hypothetical protein C7212DRAFT_328738, partial [Tuber magnatum]
GPNSGRKARKPIKVNNSAISAGDVKKVIQANYNGKEKVTKTSLYYYTCMYSSTSTKLTQLASKLKQQQEWEKTGSRGGRYKSVARLEIEQNALKEKLKKYGKLKKEKKLENRKLGVEKEDALSRLDNLNIELEEEEENLGDKWIGVEVEDENTC